MHSSVFELVAEEEKRQQETISLIPSENYCSSKVRSLVGSVLMNKYSEGYPGKRYYQGNTYIDSIETEAIKLAKELFKVPHANVQAYSGSPANSAILMATVKPGDTIMGMDLSSGGHLTHGHPSITFSGHYYHSVQFSVNKNGSMTKNDAVGKKVSEQEGEHLIDYDAVGKLALESRPSAVIVGTTAYPRFLDWKKFADIAESVGAILIADISHISGLIISGVYPSPVEYAHILMSTTHKTLRGPRGAIIMVTDKGVEKDNELPTKIDRAVFPGLQGGPHDNTTAGILQCLNEASTEEFKEYGKKIIENAKTLSDSLISNGLSLISGGTDCHLMLIDLRQIGLSGNVVAEALEVCGIVANRNSVPGDKSPFYPSGIRVGTPAVTTRGMGMSEMEQIAQWIVKVVKHVEAEKLPDDPKARVGFINAYKQRIIEDELLLGIAQEVKTLCSKFPLP